MSILTILKYPDPRLRQRARRVEEVTEETRLLVNDLLETMYAAHGMGLAATQVNVPKAIIVMDISGQPGRGGSPLVLINPVIDQLEGMQAREEGCLSFPGEFETVLRAERLLCRALDRNGEQQSIPAEGLLATCIQHEMDHLQGRLFVDHLSQLKKSRIGKRLRKQTRQAVGATR